MGVMMLAAGKGTVLTLHIDGDDADNCVQSLIELIKNRFNEEE